MSAADRPVDDDPRDTAGEYVLGTLSDDEASALEAGMARDRGLAAEVYRWQDQLLPLTRQAPSQQPTASLWRRIELAIDVATRTATHATTDAATAPPAHAAAARVPWWQRLGLWQGFSAAAVAASLVMGVLLVQRLTAPESPRFLALLQSPDSGSAGWVVEMQAGRTLRLVPVGDSAPVPPDRALQFWTKPQGAAAPTSLGLVLAGQTVELPLTRLPAVEAEQLFEITLEPAGGSPIGRPTGPILAVGRTLRL